MSQKVKSAVWRWIAIILLLGFCLTLITGYQLQRSARKQAAEVFSTQADVATRLLQMTLESETTLVFSLQGLFESFGNVTRAQFRQFIEKANVDTMYPFTQALAWYERVPIKDTAAFEERVRQDDSIQAGGYPNFSVYPVEVEDERYVVTYIEPMAYNEFVFGFDMGSHPVRRKTAEQARDRNEVLATPPLKLTTEKGTQWGFMLMLPVYDGTVSELVSERRRRFRGLVTAVFRSADLIESSSALNFTYVSVHDITDFPEYIVKFPIAGKGGYSKVFGEPIFAKGVNSADGTQTLLRQVTVGKRVWQLVFTQSIDTMMAEGFLRRLIIPLLGIAITVLAAILVGYLTSARQRSQTVADKLTVDLQLVNDELRRANKDIGQFAHMASHDLQTPVGNMLRLLELLEFAIENDDEQEPVDLLFQRIRESGVRMQELIRNLLAYAEGTRTQQFQPVDLNEMWLKVIRMTADQSADIGARFDVSPLPIVHGDSQQLERVFTNLVINAFKYSRAGVPPEIRVTANATGGMQEIRFQDNGIGIDADHHATIFKPFTRLHRHDEIAGSGLGLAICHQIMQNHGGDIAIESSSAEGTTIVLTLPGAD